MLPFIGIAPLRSNPSFYRISNGKFGKLSQKSLKLATKSSFSIDFSSRISFNRLYSTKSDRNEEEKSLKSKLEETKSILESSRKNFESKGIFNQFHSLKQRIESGDVWNEKDSPQKSKDLKQYSSFKEKVDLVNQLNSLLVDYSSVQEILKEVKDPTESDSYQQEAEKMLDEAYNLAKDLELKAFLSTEIDRCGCYIEIQAGAGGKDSCDWVGMLSDMYEKWGRNRSYTITELDRSPSETGGYKSITLQLEGNLAFGWLKRETGVHRLIRISPYDKDARRHTSFASVFVSPSLEEVGDEYDAIPPEDLRIDFTKSSGPGGQHVNTTDSAVRITHIPTNMVIKIQSDRSQHKNKEIALSVIRSRLYKMLEKKKEKEHSEARSVIGDNSFSSQIRTYTLNPYTMVKDSRTGAESPHADDVLEGGEELDAILKSLLVNPSD